MEQWIPNTISEGRYEVRGVAWRTRDHVILSAWDTRLGAARALKVLRPEARRDQLARARLINEARLLAEIQHPLVLRVFDLVPDSDVGDVLVVQAIDAVPLELMLQEGRMAPVLALRLIQDVLAALTQSHVQNVCHGAIDAEAVLVRHDGRAVLAQFGRAEFGVGPSRVQVDLAGVTHLLFKMLAGHGSDDLSHAALNPTLGVWKSLPDAVASVLRRAAHPSPSYQFQSALEMRLALDVAVRKTPPRPPPRRTSG